MKSLRLRGACTHNLKSIDLDIEPASLIALVGPSGSGKSSLAFDTLYAEGQRRYVESFSPYARQFLERLARPAVNEIAPIPAAIAVQRGATHRTSRATVGTTTEIHDYMKVLWSLAARLVCPGCGDAVQKNDPESTAAKFLEQRSGERVVITYDEAVTRKQPYSGVRERLIAEGYGRVWKNGSTLDLQENATRADVVDGGELHVIIDRLRADAQSRSRLVEALEAAMRRGRGQAKIWSENSAPLACSTRRWCSTCDTTFADPVPGRFSFNSPLGACSACKGFGRTIEIDLDKVLPDRELSLNEGAIAAWKGKATGWERRELAKHVAKARKNPDKALCKWNSEEWSWLIEGDELGYPKGWWGIRAWFKWMESRAYKMHVRVFLSRYRKYDPCTACKGTRFAPDSLAWKIGDKTIADFYALEVQAAREFLRTHEKTLREQPVASNVLDHVLQRLDSLYEVGLGYLTLDRACRSLSSGELQRVTLTAALSARLQGALFVLDEPSAGLHPSDVEHLSVAIRRLSDAGSSVMVVDHDPQIVRSADRIIELGPKSGEEGGQIVFDGVASKFAHADTTTARAFARTEKLSSANRTPRIKATLRLRGASGHNLRDVDVDFPLHQLVVVTGVSGSGKSSLVVETLYPALAQRVGVPAREQALAFESIEGWETLTNVRLVNQSALGRSSRGNVATYMGVWDFVRKRLARTPAAIERGFKEGVFSFNVAGGRCETCRGEGAETVEMQFLADVSFSCSDCQGKRFVGEVLQVRDRGLNVSQLLELTVDQMAQHFAGDRNIPALLLPLQKLGLGYLRVGQALNTLSGGEAQRLRLAEALNISRLDHTLFILDEPTSGLHLDDVALLIPALRGLVERGHSVIVVTHQMRLAAHADSVIDLGPGSAQAGGRVVASGSPRDIAAAKKSKTAPFLRVILQQEASEWPAQAKKLRPAFDGKIRIENAHEHNLQHVNVSLPTDQLIVLTGPSGSGKSTLAFDVLHAETQRRYLQTLSPYARQYLHELPRPAVESISGVPPSVALEQRLSVSGANSTVATITEVAHYLRLLWARVGQLFCPSCRLPIGEQNAELILQRLRKATGTRKTLEIWAPVVLAKKGNHRALIAALCDQGFAEAEIDSRIQTIDTRTSLERYAEHTILVRVYAGSTKAKKFSDAIARALELGKGTLQSRIDDQREWYSTRRACPQCGQGFAELDPRHFSFNTQQGRCESCEGKGVLLDEDETKASDSAQSDVAELCKDCDGTRLSPFARAVLFDGLSIDQMMRLSVVGAIARLQKVQWQGRAAAIARIPYSEALTRLEFLEEIGVGYLNLDRAALTLSGGELQRVRLAGQLGAGLTGILYVLDEPTIGLHPRDTQCLIAALRKLVDQGNTVLVVEHDADTIMAADYLVDMGPGAGHHGGNIVAQGFGNKIQHAPTIQALQKAADIPVKRCSAARGSWLRLQGVRHHNLKNVSIQIPQGCMTVVTGVSGSGKSTLVRDVLFHALRKELGFVEHAPVGRYQSITGLECIERVFEVDQSPIGRTPRSVPGTYIKIWDHIRALLAGTPEARARGYKSNRFSFNSKEGRCPTCDGQGRLHFEMAFLADASVVCDQCHGQRFTPETLEVRWRELNAGQILQLEAKDALEIFSSVPSVARPLRLLVELGLGYLQLGQPSNTLSGGEAQRIKLVAELTRAQSFGKTLYIMDEPTTGLHRQDSLRLIATLQELVKRGDTVVIIEHHPDVMCAADWIIDLGPDAGEQGGEVVAMGTPEKIMECVKSHTASVLRKHLQFSEIRKVKAASGS